MIDGERAYKTGDAGYVKMVFYSIMVVLISKLSCMVIEWN